MSYSKFPIVVWRQTRLGLDNPSSIIWLCSRAKLRFEIFSASKHLDKKKHPRTSITSGVTVLIRNVGLHWRNRRLNMTRADDGKKIPLIFSTSTKDYSRSSMLEKGHLNLFNIMKVKNLWLFFPPRFSLCHKASPWISCYTRRRKVKNEREK